MFEEERQAIDRIDRELVKLFEERMAVVAGIGRQKKARGIPVLDAEREGEILTKVAGYLENPVYEPYLHSFYEGILAASRAYQEAENSVN